jgi:hypothetical protein
MKIQTCSYPFPRQEPPVEASAPAVIARSVDVQAFRASRLRFAETSPQPRPIPLRCHATVSDYYDK